MLALDFDGVVCDALGECAAVTWLAGRATSPEDWPLPAAVASVPPPFLTTFASVRAYSRTLADFMVANAVPAGPTIGRAEFRRHRAAAGVARLADQARLAESIRAYWREAQPEQWIGLHTVHAEVAALIRAAPEPVAIVSAKDAESIRAILDAAGLSDDIGAVVGSCRDKPAALAELVADNDGRPVIFIDDNLDNVLAASSRPGVDGRWAGWGYHGREDELTADDLGIGPLSLDALPALLHDRTTTSR